VSIFKIFLIFRKERDIERKKGVKDFKEECFIINNIFKIKLKFGKKISSSYEREKK